MTALNPHRTGLWQVEDMGTHTGYRLTVALWKRTMDHHHTGLSPVDIHRLTIVLWGHMLDQHHTGLSPVDIG